MVNGSDNISYICLVRNSSRSLRFFIHDNANLIELFNYFSLGRTWGTVSIRKSFCVQSLALTINVNQLNPVLLWIMSRYRETLIDILMISSQSAKEQILFISIDKHIADCIVVNGHHFKDLWHKQYVHTSS